MNMIFLHALMVWTALLGNELYCRGIANANIPTVTILPTLTEQQVDSLCLSMMYGHIEFDDSHNFMVFNDFYSEGRYAYNFGAACAVFQQVMQAIQQNRSFYSMDSFVSHNYNDLQAGIDDELLRQKSSFFVRYQIKKYTSQLYQDVSCASGITGICSLIASAIGVEDWFFDSEIERIRSINRKDLYEAYRDQDVPAIIEIIERTRGDFFELRHVSMDSFLQEMKFEINHLLNMYTHAWLEM